MIELSPCKIKRFKLMFGSLQIASRAAVGMTFVLAVTSTNKINSFESLPLRGPSAQKRDITHEGRVCRICFEWKTFESFHRNRTKIGGVETQCKSCVLKKKSQQRNKQQGQDDIELRFSFTRSKNAWEAIDGILNLVCDEVVG
ncbi:MAG: hypothetical protein AB7F66_10940 [Bacteriovoracia bacterium]